MTIPHYVLDIFDDKPIAYVTTMRPDGHMSTNPVAALLRDGRVCISTTKDRKKVRNLRAHRPRCAWCTATTPTVTWRCVGRPSSSTTPTAP